jgi:hypothetical protein
VAESSGERPRVFASPNYFAVLGVVPAAADCSALR